MSPAHQRLAVTASTLAVLLAVALSAFLTMWWMYADLEADYHSVYGAFETCDDTRYQQQLAP
jgi:hypothetical protein